MMYMNKHPKISINHIKLNLRSKILNKNSKKKILLLKKIFCIPVNSLTIANGITTPETIISASANEERNQFVRLCKRRSVPIARQTNKFPIIPIIEKNIKNNAGQLYNILFEFCFCTDIIKPLSSIISLNDPFAFIEGHSLILICHIFDYLCLYSSENKKNRII